MARCGYVPVRSGVRHSTARLWIDSRVHASVSHIAGDSGRKQFCSAFPIPLTLRKGSSPTAV
eukprot:7379017-Prymnesium_polylepis.2